MAQPALWTLSRIVFAYLLAQKCETKTPGQILAIGKDFRDLPSGSGGTSAHMKDGVIHFPQATGPREQVVWDTIRGFSGYH